MRARQDSGESQKSFAREDTNRASATVVHYAIVNTMFNTVKSISMSQNENSTLTHLMKFAGTSRQNPATLNASLIGEGLGELAAQGLLIIKTSTREAWITQDGLEALGLPVSGDDETLRLERFVGQVMAGVLIDPETMAQIKAENAERATKRWEERRRKIMEKHQRKQ